MTARSRYSSYLDTEIVSTALQHSSHGDPACCGCLGVRIHNRLANIFCNKCGVVVRTIRASGLQKTLAEMDIALALATTQCPCCGYVHLVEPGIDKLFAFVCPKCGQSVTNLVGL